ncbi:hypothetical protein [Candidatus Nitrosotenuis uzonensis]|uniref:Uncharacterized protein n=1 Tax=Candidatus Nitrosotenuis uzonensis TaxID=1407055 RepID=A0A812EWW3_9ARCH|nr:hypothetical protein [Candidatus Nitrosotenuis uzonensis]CAE6495355.1 conserved membrane hypothetical protein [Candidatus Nitrosotenuis uzonensis]
MAELFLESILNLIGFVVGLVIGIISAIGYRNTGSPTLFRLTLAFLSISAGFIIMWIGQMVGTYTSPQDVRWVQTAGIGVQTIGYFFIAFSHTIKSFFPKSNYLRSIVILPLFLISFVSIENIIRSFSFILLIYGSIETIMSYFESRRRTALFVAAGLGALAFGEFLGWYYFVFPQSVLNVVSITVKIAGLLMLFVPVTKVPLKKIKFDENI